jgi:monoamine oxidase
VRDAPGETAIDFQGYLNGAAETGERAAGEVVDSVA